MQNAIDKITDMLNNLEKEPNKTIEDFKKLKRFYETLTKLYKFKVKDKKQIINRYNSLALAAKDIENVESLEDIVLLSEISPKSKKINKNVLRIAITSLATATVLGVAGYALKSCSNHEDQVFESVDEVVIPTPTPEIKFTEMSEETKDYADGIVLAMNDAISKGFEVTDTNKETIAKKFVNYMNITNLDTLTAEQWKTFYQDGNITGKDMMHDLFDIETIFEKIITVSENENEAIDFNLYFNETDAELLNKAEDMIIKINTATGSDRKTAVTEMHKFIIDTLTLTENRMQYSEVALNTFRGVFVNAFDVLSNGKSITDEEEHAIFTVTSHCMGSFDNNMKVEDQTISSLQSKFEIYMTEKIDTMLNKELDIEVNPYDSFDEISKYVANNIDLSLYKPAKDYEAYQEKLFLNTNSKPVTVKAKNDSGVSDGKGGVISNEQFAQYGIDPNSPNAKGKLESAVRAEFEANAEKNKITTDLDGTQVDPGQLNHYTQQGADDYNYRRGNNKSSVPSQYQDAYQNGWDNAKRIEEETRSNLQQPSTSYESIDNGNSTITNQTTIENTYTNDVPEVYEQPIVVPDTPSEPVITIEEQPYIEEFVPVEDNSVFEQSYEQESSSETYVEESIIEETNYTSSIKELEKLKNELLNLSSKYTIEESHQKC